MNSKNSLVIGGVVVFLVLSGLLWNYTEVAKERNAIERERIANEEMSRWRVECEEEVQEKFDAVDDWQKLMEKSNQSEEEIVASIQFFARGRGVADENNYLIDDEVLIQKCLDGKEWRASNE